MVKDFKNLAIDVAESIVDDIAKKYGYTAKYIPEQKCFNIGKTQTIEDDEVIEFTGDIIRIWYPRITAISPEVFEKHIEEQEKLLEIVKALQRLQKGLL